MSDKVVTSEDIVSKIKADELITEKSDFRWFERLQDESGSESQENSDTLKMRDRWGNWVLFFIGLIIVFDMILISFYGIGVWTFREPAVVIAVITDNFLKIFGLGFLITRETFKRIHQK
jgi:hypothetical protein